MKIEIPQGGQKLNSAGYHMLTLNLHPGKPEEVQLYEAVVRIAKENNTSKTTVMKTLLVAALDEYYKERR